MITVRRSHDIVKARFTLMLLYILIYNAHDDAHYIEGMPNTP